MGLIPCFLILDISSAVSVKLIANMSLIADRNTVMIANTNGIDIKDILKSKLEFFYIIKSFKVNWKTKFQLPHLSDWNLLLQRQGVEVTSPNIPVVCRYQPISLLFVFRSSTWCFSFFIVV